MKNSRVATRALGGRGYRNYIDMLYVLIGVISPIVLNGIHMLIGIMVLKKYNSISSLGFSGVSFVTKTLGMLYLTWLGVSILQLNYKIFVPLLAFFWFITHIVEAFVIQYYIKNKK